MTDEELKAKLLEVESGKGGGDCTSNWHRNPEGPQAVARIEELEAVLSSLYGQVYQAIDCWICADSPSMDEAMRNAREALKGTDHDG